MSCPSQGIAFQKKACRRLLMKAARLIFASDLCSNIAKQTTPKTL